MNNVTEIPKDSNPSEEVKERLQNFTVDLIALCNKHRIWLSIGDFGHMPNKVSNTSKLLDVSGFYRDTSNNLYLPVFTDILSGDNGTS